MHLGIILFNDQLDAQFFFVYVYFHSLHVSSIQVLITGDSIASIRYLVYVTLCRWPSGMQVWTSVQTCIPDGQSDVYQISYWYNWISWWWALECSKHVENWNKHKRNCAPSWSLNRIRGLLIIRANFLTPSSDFPQKSVNIFQGYLASCPRIQLPSSQSYNVFTFFWLIFLSDSNTHLM